MWSSYSLFWQLFHICGETAQQKNEAHCPWGWSSPEWLDHSHCTEETSEIFVSTKLTICHQWKAETFNYMCSSRCSLCSRSSLYAWYHLIWLVAKLNQKPHSQMHCDSHYVKSQECNARWCWHYPDLIVSLRVKEAQKWTFFQYTDLDAITTAHVDVGHYICRHYCVEILFANTD